MKTVAPLPRVTYTRAAALARARATRGASVAALQQFVRLPSVSGRPETAADVRRCARWLAAHLRRSGLADVRVIDTPGAPIVWAVWRAAGPSAPTALLYGHYDVQPVEPVSAWKTGAPFSGTVANDPREGLHLLGRGASDDKGPLLAMVAAVEAYLRSGALPVNIICLFEGEEEVGSPHLAAFLERVAPLVRRCACVLVSDTRMAGPNRPALVYGQRGQVAFELTVRGPSRDLHSGAFGGAVADPALALCRMLAGLAAAPNGRLTLGTEFYRSVLPATSRERRSLRRSGTSDRALLHTAGPEAAATKGEAGYTLFERTTLRPALTVNGLTAGHQGPGPKGIVPAQATAKFSLRLAAGQSPAQSVKAVRRRLTRLLPPRMHATLTVRAGATPPVLVPRDHGALRAAARACARGFGRRPVLLRSGGTTPVVALLARRYGVTPVLLGLSLAEDGLHGPDERFALARFYRGTETFIHFFAELAEGYERQPA